MANTSLKIAGALTLRAPDGSDLPVTDVSADLDLGEKGLSDAILHLSLSPAYWARADAGGWFHMPPDQRGPTFAGGFLPDQPVEVEARLRADLLPGLAAVGASKWEIGAELKAPEAQPALHQTEAWVGLHVKQQRGGVKTGFSTLASGMLG